MTKKIKNKRLNSYELTKNYFNSLNGKIARIQKIMQVAKKSKSTQYKVLKKLLDENFIFKDKYRYYGKK